MKLPPFLLAAALAFWGWRTGNTLPAALLALAAEAPRLTAVRFELRHADLQRVADLCGTLFVGLVVWLLATIEPPRVARAVLTSLLWLPAVLAPVLLAQQFNASGRIPLSAIFRYLRRMRARDPSIPDPAVDLGPVYFAACVLAGGIPNQRDGFFYAAVVVLIGWALVVVRPRRTTLPVWIGTLALAAGLGFAGHRGLGELQAKLEDWISDWQLRGIAGDPYRSTTDLGAVGRLKMIDSILLRVYATPQEAQRLKLLHRASFTTLRGSTWLARGAPMRALAPLADGTTWPLAEGTSTLSARIFAQLDGGKALLALPAGTVRISAMAASTVQRNAFGAVQAELGGDWAPYVVEVGDAAGATPPQADELQIPAPERAEFERLAAQLNLAKLKPAQAASRVREHLAGFAYSTYRDSPVPSGSTPLGDFIARARSGHCEYFAAAATLLLRAAGIPARYATGFALTEYSPLEEAYVVRARHAHAWTRVWIDGAWIDLDTTPPSWVEEEERGKPAWQPLLDVLRWAGFRWSQRGEMQAGLGWLALVVLLAGIFVWRMLKGKLAKAPAAPMAGFHGPRHGEDSEFFAVEELLAARAGARPPSESLAAWIAGAAAALDESVKRRLAEALALHNRHRFDPAGLGAQERAALRAQCLTLQQALLH